MNEIFLGVKDPNIFSYSRFYHFWKKRILISKLFAGELRRNKESIKVLDIGCGWGTDLFYLNSLYKNFRNSIFVGLDLSEDNIKFCNDAKNTKEITNINFLIGDIENTSFKDGTFDVVICSEVLEHLPNPTHVIMEIRKILKDGGALIITTPNKSNYFLKIASLFKFLGLWKHKREGKIEQVIPPFGKGFGHISTKNLYEWNGIFHEAKFKIESVKRGVPISGGIYYDSFNFLFATLVIIDILFDCLPFTNNFTETVIMKLRKPCTTTI
jgi:ubiquinone/menaquinone biosynthesis C-methylase UbiE